jgi:hypothetical protein
MSFLQSRAYSFLVPNPYPHQLTKPLCYNPILFSQLITMVVSRHEPVFQIYRETEEFQLCQEKYARSGWMPFLEKFTGWHEKISHEFIQSYDGEIAHIGNLQLTINEATLREVTGLPNRGAKYFKGVGINKEMCQ